MENITVSIITWNNIHLTKILVESILKEINKIKNYNFIIRVGDNASTDGTIEYLKEKNIKIIEFNKNKGISYPKHFLVKEAIKDKSKYMFLFDNDVQVIPNSFLKMIKYMDLNSEVGCFGQHIDYYSKDLNDKILCNDMPDLNNLNILKNVKSGCGAVRAWTHYGIYRVSVFESGVNYDITPPMGEPGYGFGDDDLGMQIYTSGNEIHCFTHIFCFHDCCSSVPILKKLNQLNFDKREKYFKEKWKDLI